MNKRIKNILRCYAAGIGIKETASTFHISRNTVRKYVRLFLSSGKSIEQLLSLPNGQLDELFGCTDTRHREPSSKRIELEVLLPGYVWLSGNFWLLSFKISYLCLPLFYETRTTPSCHPSGCAYRQL